jgi:hypothetical protein
MVAYQTVEKAARCEAIPPGEGIDGSVVWRGAALARNRRPRDIWLEVCMTGNLLKRAAPGNVSTRVRFVGTSRGPTVSEHNDEQNQTCGSFREPPV